MTNRTVAEIFPPGEFIADELTARGWSQVELAEILGRPPRLISELLAGKRAITPETAKGLGAAFGTGPEFWMNLERDYQLSRVMHDDTAVARRARLYAKAPVKEMVKRSWIEPSENIDVLEKRVLDFFDQTSIDEEIALPHAARKSSYKEVSPAQWAWLFRVRQIARQTSVSSFSKMSLANALEQLERLLIAPEEARHVPKILADCGVRFVVVEKLPQARIDGVCLWLDDNSPVIGMSLSRDKIDNFWFVLRHEIEHVLQGHGRGGFMIDIELTGESASNTSPSISEEERIANTSASNFCTPISKLDSFMARKHPFYYERDVIAFARILNRHPGMVVGQMQFRMNNYSYLTKHLSKVRNFVLPEAIVDGWEQTPASLQRLN